MKKFYVLLLSLAIPFATLFADENELHVSGMVYENPEVPVPGYQVNIEIPPSNVFDGYFNEVFTNEEGYYVDEILLPENVIQGEIFLSTVDCNGEIITEMFMFSPEMMEIEHDFFLCDDPFPDCEAGFIWEPLEGNVIQFFNTSLPENINSIWEFGDGTTSEEQNPVHEYAEQGVYEVCLLIYNDELNCEDQFCMEVFVGNNTGCEAFFEWGPAPDNPMVIAFFNQSTGGEELEFEWDFGDGETSDEMNPVHDFAEPGVYEVCLEISGEGCEDDFCTEVFVDEWPGECMAMFEYEIYEDHTVQFFNFSFPPESNYLWEFGDGQSSEEFEPMHTYTEPGEYEVCLTVWNDEFNCEDQMCMEIFIGGGGECNAFFEWMPAPNSPLTIEFINLSTGGEELEFEWDFGDGETSDEMNPVHDFAEPGVYEVCLEISGEGCEDDFCTEVFVEEWPGECMAMFEYEIYEDHTVQFFNFSFPSESNYLWEFGDGEASEEFEPMHTYTEPGEYEVCLTVWNDEFNCEDQMCMEIFIGGGGECNAFFEWMPAPNSPLTIEFINLSTGGEELEFEWDFGDGETSDELNPVHDYAEPGIYEVCLEISGEDCEDEFCTEVFVEEWPGECMAMFEYEINEDNTVQFFNFSFPPESNYLWEFGDGQSSEEFEPMHTYTEPGEYEVCLTVWNDEFNCEDQMCMEIFIGGGGECEAYYTWWPTDEPMTIQFIDFSWIENGQFHWEFGDGTTGEGPMPAHSYQEPGVYEVCLVAFNNECEDIYCEAVVVEGNSGGGECEAGFEWQQLEGLQIQFLNSSWPQEAEFFWDFGDDNAYWEHSPVHLYDEPGVYQVCLTIYTADGCEDQFCQEVMVEGQGGGGLHASFEVEADPQDPMTLHFWDTSSGDPVQWLWEFGDETISEAQNPSHTYDAGGTYNICLTVFNNFNDPDTYCMEVEISEAYFSGIDDNSKESFTIYPNPASSEAIVDFVLAEPQQITMEIHNALMQKVRTVDAGLLDAGEQSLRLPVAELQEGIYMVSLMINGKYFTEKIIISR